MSTRISQKRSFQKSSVSQICRPLFPQQNRHLFEVFRTHLKLQLPGCFTYTTLLCRSQRRCSWARTETFFWILREYVCINYVDMRKSTCYWRLKASYPDSFQSVGPGVRNNLSIIDDILHILNVFYMNHIYIIFQYTILFAQIQSLYFTLKYKQNSNTTTLLQFGYTNETAGNCCFSDPTKPCPNGKSHPSCSFDSWDRWTSGHREWSIAQGFFSSKRILYEVMFANMVVLPKS